MRGMTGISRSSVLHLQFVEMREMRDKDLEQQVSKLYDQRLPYHNFNHVIVTLKAADDITRRRL